VPRTEETNGEPVAPILELRGVTKRFGEVNAVDEISLAVQPGEFLTILGASGCGKTTTLRLIAGFETATAGQVLMDGADMTWLPPFKRPINTVFQQYALFPHLSVRDNVAYGLRMRGVRRSEISTRVGEALDLVQLRGLADRAPRQLSGGQQQRVALARAIVNRPRVLLLDEPLGALDLKLRRAMQLELKRLQTQLGITFIYVTHDQEEALTMSDRVALMNHGRIEQLGAPRSLYDRPRSRYVADFIGETNLLRGVVTDDAGSSLGVSVAGGVIRAGLTPDATADARRPGAEAWVSIRPEAMAVAPTADDSPGGASGEACLRGVVSEVVYAGSVVKLHVTLPDGTRIVTHRAPTLGLLTAGTPVLVTVASGCAVLVGS
jgi:spermidine/putrescine transport system ATP-binding protein